jgi:hypothetical protein
MESVISQICHVINLKTRIMRQVRIEIANRELIIYEWSDLDPNLFDFYEDTPIHLPLEDALETVNLEGYGTNLSKFIVDLLTHSWSDSFYVDAIIKFLRKNYPKSNIDWEATLNYVDLFR